LLSQLDSFLGYFVHFPQQEKSNNIEREAEEEEADSLFVSSATKNAIQVIFFSILISFHALSFCNK
jgi:hypothetical protein